jgi:hypothetical protein
MRAKILVTVLSVFFVVGQTVAQTREVSIVLNGESTEYKSLDDIKPSLVNATDHSIFLFPDDCGQARLWLYYMNKSWRPSVWKECATDTIEVKPGETYQIPQMVWRPLRTYDGKLIERKTFPGRYRMMMRYSLTNVNVRSGVPHLTVRTTDPNYEAANALTVVEVTKEFTVVP